MSSVEFCRNWEDQREKTNQNGLYHHTQLYIIIRIAGDKVNKKQMQSTVNIDIPNLDETRQ